MAFEHKLYWLIYQKIADGPNPEEIAKEIEAISEAFTTAFWEWRSNTPIKNIDQYTNAETLRMFKQEKGI
jgi:hypothetical protein